MLVCSIDRDFKASDGSASVLLEQCSRRVELGLLTLEQTRTLLASLFDDGPYIDVLAAVAHRRCHGNPRALLEAARGLVKAGLVRHEGGTWLIDQGPDVLSAAIDGEQGIEQRLSSLSPDAVELIETVAFDRHSIVDLGRHLRLSRHRSSIRMHRALSELLETQWVELAEDRIHLIHEDRREAIVAQIPDARRRELHVAMAEHCVEQAFPPVYEAHHRLEAGDTAGAVAALDRFHVFVDQNPHAEILKHPITLETTEAISRLQNVPGAHPAMSAKYLAATALNATYRALAEFTAERLPASLAALAHFSGLHDYARLTHLLIARKSCTCARSHSSSSAPRRV